MASASNRVLITGLDSFTGKHLCKKLSNLGYQVYGTSHQRSEGLRLLQCDVSKEEDCRRVVEQVNPNYVIHLAGISFVGHAQTDAFYRVNTIGTEYLLKAITEYSPDVKKVILASSATIYGDQGVEVLDESLTPRPANHYGISKLAMEHVASGFFTSLPVVITRPFNYTGIGQPDHFLVPKIVSHFKQGKATIELGNLHVAREFNDVELASDVYAKLLLCDDNGVCLNLCSGKSIRLLDIIELMNKIAGYKIKVNVNPAFVRPNEIPRLVGSPYRLQALIGMPIEVGIEETLRRMYEN